MVGVNIFELLREQVSLEEVVGAKTGEKARCVAPWHEDIDPSMHLYDDHVHCFGCGLRGDVVDVWAARHGIERPIDAARDLAREFNIELPELDPEAKRKAEEWRKREAACMRKAQERHEALERHPQLREWWLSRGFDEELQKRYLLGASADGRRSAGRGRRGTARDRVWLTRPARWSSTNAGALGRRREPRASGHRELVWGRNGPRGRRGRRRANSCGFP